ncbi:phage protein [Bacillus cereus VD133]|uniref:Phage protein n=1 Tax=Bacillus cereus VD133 TaxID=1053233 RepID=A0A9W5PWB5_BACCE|nr:Rho termination factor N-terminal domain-containing protein [Bacillus cereus]EOO41247.1 phage protein [Bacillus cereus VD133]
MIVETRRTVSGTEYWDTTKKRSLFVPTSEEPGFEVTVNPESMIAKFADDKVIDVKVIELDDMTVKELRDYAASINVEIPADVKKKEDIIKLLS